MEKINNILQKLKLIAKKAYAPYSNFCVASILEFEDGVLIEGVNIENAAFPNCMCAERVALYNAYLKNLDLNKIENIYIYSPQSNDFLSPCGSCRQTLSEFIFLNPKVYMFNKNDEYIMKNFDDLFPLKILKNNIVKN